MYNRVQNLVTREPIEQSTDNKTNQTGFIVNFQNAYDQSSLIQVENFNNLKCKYCKGFYFPVQSIHRQQSQQVSSHKNKDKNKQVPLVKDIKKEQKQFICQLCGSINQLTTVDNLKQFPQFKQRKTQIDQHRDKYSRFNSDFQSVIISKSAIKQNKKQIEKGLNQNNHEVYFVFVFDVDSFEHSIKFSIVNYLKTVIRQYFSIYLQKETQYLQQKQDKDENTELKQNEIYKIALLICMNDKLFMVDFSTLSTICVDQFVKTQLVDTNIQGWEQRKKIQDQQKQGFIQLLKNTSVKITSSNSLSSIDEYFELFSQELQSVSSLKPKHPILSCKFYNQLMSILAHENSSMHSYVSAWMTHCPLLNFQAHRVKKYNIYSIVYLFYSLPQQKQNQKLKSASIKISQKSLHQYKQSFMINIKNQIAVIKDNSQVHLIECLNDQIVQFYYKLYELFKIVEYIKIFRPKFTFKTDSKYPPNLTNPLPGFFIKQSTSLLFVVSSLLNQGSHSNFQLSIHFQNGKRQQKLWIINWTKDVQKQKFQLKNSHKQNLSTHKPLERLPLFYNYFYVLINYGIQASLNKQIIKVRNKQVSQHNNFISVHQFTILFQTIINKGVYKSNNIDIQIEYVEKVHQFCDKLEKISEYHILKCFSLIKHNMKQALCTIFPLVVRFKNSNLELQNQQNDSSIHGFLIYWSYGYCCLKSQKIHGEDEFVQQNNQDFNELIEYLNQNVVHQYFSKNFNSQQENINEKDNQLKLFYVNKFIQSLKNQEKSKNYQQNHVQENSFKNIKRNTHNSNYLPPQNAQFQKFIKNQYTNSTKLDSVIHIQWNNQQS